MTTVDKPAPQIGCAPSARDVDDSNGLFATGVRDRSPRSALMLGSGVITVVLVAGLSGCGGGADGSAAAQSVAATAAPLITEAPVATQAPVITESPVVSAAPVPEMSVELAAFANANSELLDAWAAQLDAFGEEAATYIGDVSQAPTAASTLELSDQMFSAIGDDASDAGLVTLRSFASEMSAAIGASIDGDQDAALTGFIALQAKSEPVSAVLAQLDA